MQYDLSWILLYKKNCSLHSRQARGEKGRDFRYEKLYKSVRRGQRDKFNRHLIFKSLTPGGLVPLLHPGNLEKAKDSISLPKNRK